VEKKGGSGRMVFPDAPHTQQAEGLRAHRRQQNDFIDFTPEASQQSAVETTKLTRIEEPTLLFNYTVA